MNYKRIRNLEKMALLTKDTTMKLRYNEMKIPIIGFDTTLDVSMRKIFIFVYISVTHDFQIKFFKNRNYLKINKNLDKSF